MVEPLKLFVCGSFCSDWVHFPKISKYIVKKDEGFVKGTCYRLPTGYPVISNEGSDLIWGELFELELSPILVSLLDEFHGYNPMNPQKSLFLKSNTNFYLSEGVEPVEVFSYLINLTKLPKGVEKINGGDWREDLKSRPTLIEQLTEQQSDYIYKLGASTGREIVPINLDLYRELMKLDLIVDKGRRLALSKLGKEVFKYMR